MRQAGVNFFLKSSQKSGDDTAAPAEGRDDLVVEAQPLSSPRPSLLSGSFLRKTAAEAIIRKYIDANEAPGY